MTKTIKNAMVVMEYCNPYEINASIERKNAYTELWNSLRTLRNLDIISKEEWDKIFELDHKMYIAE